LYAILHTISDSEREELCAIQPEVAPYLWGQRIVGILIPNIMVI
jgi:hypothetical protein